MGRLLDLARTSTILTDAGIKALANHFGITISEMSQVKYRLSQMVDDHGVLLYYNFLLNEGTPKEILKKVKDLDDSNVAIIEPWILGDDEEYYERKYHSILNSKDLFPTLLLPNRIINILNEIEILPSKPSEPIAPKKPIFNDDKLNPFVFIYPIASIILLGLNHYFIALFLLAIFILVLIIHANDKKTNIIKSKKFEVDFITYNNNTEDYIRKIEKHNEIIESFEDEYFKEVYKKELIIDFFKNSPTFDSEVSSKKGITENYFHLHLLEYFKDEIFIDKAVGNMFPRYKKQSKYYGYSDLEEINPYCPDFIFKHQSNLHIDIEIDEPYTEGIPIHDLNNNSDRLRNLYFLKKGWVLIRFAEEQVVNDAIGCCHYIALIIYKLTGDKSYLSKFSLPLKLKEVNIWTEADAIKLMQNNHRNLYLSAIK